MMYWYGPEMGAWGYLLMTLSMIVFWGVVIGGIVALIRYASRPSTRPEASPARTPEQLLGERFARGEIDEDEYRRRLDALRGARADTGT